jgi:hypothetical protein
MSTATFIHCPRGDGYGLSLSDSLSPMLRIKVGLRATGGPADHQTSFATLLVAVTVSLQKRVFPDASTHLMLSASIRL